MTGITSSTVKKIVSEYNRAVQTNSEVSSPKKKRKRMKSKSFVDDFDSGVIRNIIYSYHLQKKEFPTLGKLLPIIRSETNFDGQITSLRSVIKEIGFKWGKTKDNKNILCEKYDIVIKRIQF
jgi:transposase